MPFTYNSQQKVVENVESSIKDLRGQQDDVNKRVTSKHRRYKQLNKLAYDETASNSKRGDAVAKRPGAYAQWQAAVALQGALPARIHVEEVKLIKAREELSKMKPLVSKLCKSTHPARSGSHATGRAKTGSPKANKNAIASQINSREAQKIRERQKNATRVAKPDASAVKKKIEVKEPQCDFKGTARGRAVENEKSRKRERSESPHELSQPARVHKCARHHLVVYSDDESDDATGGKGGIRTVQRNGSSGEGNPPKGKKRKDESSAGDDSAPVLKKAKINFKDRNSNTSRSGSGKKDSAATNSPETSYRQSTSSEGDKTRVSDTSASSVTVESADDKSSSSGRTRELPFKGIKNIGNSCFSSAAIQLLDAALEGEGLDRLLGKLVKTEKFGITDKDCQRIDTRFGGTNTREKAGMRREVRRAVRDCAKKDADKVSIAKHLRKLLEDLRTEDDIAVSAFRSQSVMAEGGQDEQAHESRQTLNGDTQQDASEYFTVMMDALREDPNMQDADSLDRIFGIATQTLRFCPTESCGVKSTTLDPISYYHGVGVDEDTSFQAAFEESKHSVTDIDCPVCNDDGEVDALKLKSTVKFLKAPENLVVSMGRCSHDQRQVKNTASIHLGQHDFGIDDTKYVLSAVVMHKGVANSRDETESAVAGHYYISRKHGEDWYAIDDREVTKVSKEAVADTENGHSAMLLFRKQHS